MAIEATTLVQFGGFDAANDLVLFELDSTMNNNRSSFSPGDVIYFNVQVSDGVEILDMVATHGAIQQQGTVTYTNNEFFDFTDRSANETFNLGRIPTGAATIKRHLGRIGSATFSQTSNRVTQITGQSEFAPYKLEVEYNYSSFLYRLQTPTVALAQDETYPITVTLYLDKRSTDTDECNR